MGKEKGQRGGKTNVRHTFYVVGFRQTPSMIVSYRQQQFSLQLRSNSSSSRENAFDFSL